MADSESLQKSVAIIGAGPAGLTAAYTLLKKSGGRIKVTVCEADPEYVGGISRTVNYKGFHFDIGGHRFFSKSQEVEDLWTELLPADMLERPRLSRIFYRGKFFSYPLRALEALFKLGFVESILCMASYVRARLFPIPDPKSFEDWVTNKFGRRLFKIFFKTYTEKVWGMSCRDISADWAAQRIKDLSLVSAIVNSLLPQKASRPNKHHIKTLVNTFRYPRRGPGMLWAACAEKVASMGGEILPGRRVTRCVWNKADGLWTIEAQDGDGKAHTIQAQHLISSAPLRQLAQSLSPALPERVLNAARSLKYRDFLTVSLIVKDRGIFQDNWIYIHDPGVRVGRIQNFKSWSPEMVPSPDLNCYGLEYFCFEGDGLWSASDERLVELATSELVQIGLAEATDVLDGCVVRQAKAYPVYDDAYAEHVEVLRAELEAHFPTLHLVGRNGMHKYNNQDHAMMTAMLCAENILAGARLYDVWCVNQDAEYHEQGDRDDAASTSGMRLVPSRLGADE
ncbi:MAG TPA: NAD(P)/FAD-dependent oxidoreductase [Pyrinomonadaceae bacterium]|nr:NAD(P)/FAD-dependent oxidoreductase [Pyrinomonadaceae bacterium]